MENENYKGVNPDVQHEGENCEADPRATDHEMDDDEAAKERLTSDDPTKVKFTSVSLDHAGKNGEAKVDIGNVRTTVGMGKEELMKYANDPFWIRLRMTLFVLFWVVWVAMLVGAVVIIFLAPRCAPPPRLDWWQKSVVYQVYVSSFKDGNGDGRGDLKGLISKLDYFEKLKVDTLLLSPIYPSPMKDNGYDVTNYTDIDPVFGTMQDFKDLLSEMKKKEMKLLIDFVPNHSSNEHPWFKASENREKPYEDYYIWEDGKGGDKIPPNNWISVFGKSAWQWSDKRKQFYLHQFLPDQPDLNLRNENVKEELKSILEFWLDMNVDGFRIDAATHLFEDLEMKDEPEVQSGIDKKDDYDSLSHIYTKAQPEVFEILREWRELLNNYSISTGVHKLLITENYDSLNTTMHYYGTTDKPLVDMPFNFHLLDLTGDSSAEELKERMISWTSSMPEGKWPNWVLGNHDNPRLATRVDRELIDGFHMVALLAQGTPVCYYGDELGMEDYKDPSMTDQRSPARTPMQWSNETNAGFTDASVPWLPVHPEYPTINVEMEEKNSRSYLEIFKSLVALRHQPAILFGIQEYPYVTEDVFSLLRVRKGSPGYLMAMNMGSNGTIIVNFKGKSKYLPEFGHLEIRSNNIVSTPRYGTDRPKIKLDNIVLGPKQSVVFSFVPVFQE